VDAGVLARTRWMTSVVTPGLSRAGAAPPGASWSRHTAVATRRHDVADYEQLGFPELIDISTLAKLLGVGERYVRRMIAERRVPTVKVGRLVRFDLAEIRRWIEEQRRPPAGEA
jgi:excisionase family DNA binding protein